MKVKVIKVLFIVEFIIVITLLFLYQDYLYIPDTYSSEYITEYNNYNNSNLSFIYHVDIDNKSLDNLYKDMPSQTKLYWKNELVDCNNCSNNISIS